jgi:hypothetical protein
VVVLKAEVSRMSSLIHLYDSFVGFKLPRVCTAKFKAQFAYFATNPILQNSLKILLIYPFYRKILLRFILQFLNLIKFDFTY